MCPKHIDDRGCIACRFEHDVIVTSKLRSKSLELVSAQSGATAGTQDAAFQIRDLGDRSRHIQTNNAHSRSPMENT
jgi:hypothetical protein